MCWKPATKPSTAEKLAVQGSRADISAGKYRRLTSLEVTLTENPMESELPEKVYIEGAIVVLRVKIESEAVGAQSARKVRVESAQSELMETMASEVQFKVLPAEVASFAKPTYEVQIIIWVSESAFHSSTCLVDTDERSKLFNKAYLKPHWKCRFKSLDVSSLWTAREETIKVLGIILLHLKMRTLQVPTSFGEVQIWRVSSHQARHTSTSASKKCFLKTERSR